jgi:four helix bundle protein
MSNEVRKYDWKERTSKFGEVVIKFAKQLPQNAITHSLISQLVRSATSVGANYQEADSAESRKDFEHKLGISKKEAAECKHWLNMVMHAEPDFKTQAEKLIQESQELQLIFITIIKKSRENSIN